MDESVGVYYKRDKFGVRGMQCSGRRTFTRDNNLNIEMILKVSIILQTLNVKLDLASMLSKLLISLALRYFLQVKTLCMLAVGHFAFAMFNI